MFQLALHHFHRHPSLIRSVWLHGCCCCRGFFLHALCFCVWNDFNITLFSPFPSLCLLIISFVLCFPLCRGCALSDGWSAQTDPDPAWGDGEHVVMVLLKSLWDWEPNRLWPFCLMTWNVWQSENQPFYGRRAASDDSAAVGCGNWYWLYVIHKEFRVKRSSCQFFTQIREKIVKMWEHLQWTFSWFRDVRNSQPTNVFRNYLEVCLQMFLFFWIIGRRYSYVQIRLRFILRGCFWQLFSQVPYIWSPLLLLLLLFFNNDMNPHRGLHCFAKVFKQMGRKLFTVFMFFSLMPIKIWVLHYSYDGSIVVAASCCPYSCWSELTGKMDGAKCINILRLPNIEVGADVHLPAGLQSVFPHAASYLCQQVV